MLAIPQLVLARLKKILYQLQNILGGATHDVSTVIDKKNSQSQSVSHSQSDRAKNIIKYTNKVFSIIT